MFPGKQEIALSLIACWRLVFRDRDAMDLFDTSAGGMWRSFSAALIAFPAFLLLKSLMLAGAGPEIDTLRFLVVHSIAYVVGWTLFPLVMVTLSEVFDREERLFAFIVAFNWSTVLQIGLFTAIALLVRGGIVTGVAGSLAMLAATGAVLWYEWYIATVALKITGVQAGLVVLADVMLGLLVAGIASSLIVP
jgi:hypothetical protein